MTREEISRDPERYTNKHLDLLFESFIEERKAASAGSVGVLVIYDVGMLISIDNWATKEMRNDGEAHESIIYKDYEFILVDVRSEIDKKPEYLHFYN